MLKKTSSSPSPPLEKWVTVRYAYTDTSEGYRVDDLLLTLGESILVLDDSDPGWWKGWKLDGREGYFPYNYVA